LETNACAIDNLPTWHVLHYLPAGFTVIPRECDASLIRSAVHNYYQLQNGGIGESIENAVGEDDVTVWIDWKAAIEDP